MSFIDLVLYLQLPSAISWIFTFSISTHCLVLPPNEVTVAALTRFPFIPLCHTTQPLTNTALKRFLRAVFFFSCVIFLSHVVYGKQPIAWVCLRVKK